MNKILKVGDAVRFSLGLDTLTGLIKEDRGPIGIAGKHIYEVVVPTGEFEDAIYEIQSDELEVVPLLPRSSGPLNAQKVMDYFKNKGKLIEILRRSISGGRRQPRVWLYAKPNGQIEYTFRSERGQIGGATIPFWTTSGDHISPRERERVRVYLRNFGLRDEQADEVVESVANVPV